MFIPIPTLSRKALRRTLDEANVPDNHVRIISHASPNDKAAAARTHETTNDLIRSCLDRNSLGTCIHITGRMSALNDPYHSHLCKSIVRKIDSPFQFLYHDIGEPDDNPLSIVKQKKHMWSRFGWRRILDSMQTEAMEQVLVFASRIPSDVEYSVFGNKYILLQSAHQNEAGAYAKHVWLLESQQTHDHLAEQALRRLKEIDKTPSFLFDRAIELFRGVSARSILQKLLKNQGLPETKLLDADVLDFTNEPTDVLTALAELGFIHLEDADCWNITPAGSEFISAYEQ